MAEYIERDALETTLNRRLNFLMAENGEYDHYTSGFDEAVTIVEDCPSADVAPAVHGRWEKWNGDNRHHCTVCECYANAERDSYGYIAYEFLDNYCPNCGAKMDGE